jgi:hypothetical protein
MTLHRLTGTIRRFVYKLMNPLAFRYGAMMGLVLWGCCVQLDYRRPGASPAWLSWLGTVLSIVSFLLLVNSSTAIETPEIAFIRWCNGSTGAPLF